MDYKALKDDIKLATKQCFSELQKKYPNDNVCGYALYSDSDATSVSPAMNTLAHLQELQAEDPDDKAYYKWSPGEWAHEFEGAEFFSAISKALFEEAKSIIATEKLIAFRKNVYEACVSGLEELLKEGVFPRGAEEFVLVFTLSDSEVPDDEIQWIKRLNTEKNANEFESWINSLDEE